MKPESKSRTFLKITQSRAKMFEYAVPTEEHIDIQIDPAQLFSLTIGMLGDAAANLNRVPDISGESKNLQFSARFFNAYMEGKFLGGNDHYLLLLASAAFYLSHIPGSAHVLAKRVPMPTPDVGGEGLERLFHWLLLGTRDNFVNVSTGAFVKNIQDCVTSLVRYYEGDGDETSCLKTAAALRASGYAFGTPRQLLLVDLCAAMINLRIKNSARRCLPIYSKLSLQSWDEVLKKKGFLAELWPSQQLLGEKGVYSGASAIVQMPTSAGKTRATELVIRSAFLAKRTSLAVIVAPFRALCHEISDAFKQAFRGEGISVDELTDVLQPDFDFDFLLSDKFEILQKQRILVVTPEKLLYVLRHEPELADSIGLVIYDEGHQFDSGIRGVTYELLLTALKNRISKDTQIVLISAVISNADAIGTWLLGENPIVATGLNLSPMQRRVAFTGWNQTLGQLHFMEEDALELEDFFVPRLVSQQTLKKRGKERKPRLFPVKGDSNSIALYLGVKLVNNGSVAIFCGRKDTVAGICEDIVDVYSRELSFPKPSTFSNMEEVIKIAGLYAANLGDSAPTALAAALGILSHTGNTPHGVRLSVEYAIKEGDAKFVVCTSTLAQGVNLPIRYLIVTSVYQGGEQIRVRDFHNLIGRAGRAGMHVEGTIIFADPKIYDGRMIREESWRWPQTQQLLNPLNSEPVVSSIQSLFDPFVSDDGGTFIQLNLVDVARWYTSDRAMLQKALGDFAEKNASDNFTVKGLSNQAEWKFKIFAAIESYLMAYWEGSDRSRSSQSLAEGTLAYALLSEEQQKQLVELFGILAEHVHISVPDAERRAAFARTLQGVTTNLELETWVKENYASLQQVDNHEELLKKLWPIIAKGIDNSIFQKIDKPELMLMAAIAWISGHSFGAILHELNEKEVKILWGATQKRDLTIEHIVEICEGAYGYDGALRLGAIADLLGSQNSSAEEVQPLIQRLGELQKRFKYGLPHTSAVAIYESGFADRVVAQKISNALEIAPKTRSAAISMIAAHRQIVESILEIYPKYFRTTLAGLD